MVNQITSSVLNYILKMHYEDDLRYKFTQSVLDAENMIKIHKCVYCE